MSVQGQALALAIIAKGSVAQVREALPTLDVNRSSYGHGFPDDGYFIPLLYMAVFRAKYVDPEVGLRIMRLLLTEGSADVDIVRPNGRANYQTPLWLAMQEAEPSDEPIVTMLLKAGATYPLLPDTRWLARRFHCRALCVALLAVWKRTDALPSRDMRNALLAQVWGTRFDTCWERIEPLMESKVPRLCETYVLQYFE